MSNRRINKQLAKTALRVCLMGVVIPKKNNPIQHYWDVPLSEIDEKISSFASASKVEVSRVIGFVKIIRSAEELFDENYPTYIEFESMVLTADIDEEDSRETFTYVNMNSKYTMGRVVYKFLADLKREDELIERERKIAANE